MGVYGKIENIIVQENLIDDIKKKVVDLKALKEQWKKSADKFVKHKWIYRYINEQQKKTTSKTLCCSL